MATIPRLPPANNPLDVTITVNVRLRPYFTEWFQQTKEPGETPEQFALRNLKFLAATWYINDKGQEQIAELNQDSELLRTEVE